MTQREENKQKMYLGLCLICEAAAPTTSVVPQFNESYQEFLASVTQIGKLARKQAQKTKGITLGKQQLRKAVSELGAQVAGAVAAYGNKVNNLELAGRVNYSVSDLLGGRDVASADNCQIVHTAAQEFVGALGPFGVTAQKLTDLATLIEDFREVIQKPRNARSTGKSVTKQLKDEFENADRILTEELDKLALQFKATAPEFYNDYQNARAIVDDAATHEGGTESQAA